MERQGYILSGRRINKDEALITVQCTDCQTVVSLHVPWNQYEWWACGKVKAERAFPDLSEANQRLIDVGRCVACDSLITSRPKPVITLDIKASGYEAAKNGMSYSDYPPSFDAYQKRQWMEGFSQYAADHLAEVAEMTWNALVTECPIRQSSDDNKYHYCSARAVLDDVNCTRKNCPFIFFNRLRG